MQLETHEFDLEEAQLRDPKAAPTWLWFICGVVSLIVTVIYLQALYYGYENDQQIQKAEGSAVHAKSLKQEQEAQLSDYAEVIEEQDEQDVTVYRIPIDKAMEFEVLENAQE